MKPTDPRNCDDGAELRFRMVSVLDPVEQLPALLACLSDESWRVRKAAIERIVQAPARPLAVEALVSLLGRADDAAGRNAAAEALVRIGREAVAAVAGSLQDADSDVRKFAADILGQVGDHSAAGSLIEALHDPEQNVRAAAAEALGNLGGPEAAAALEEALSGGDSLTKAAALDALGRLGKAPPLSVLAPLARDKSLRRPVLRLLGKLSGRATLELIAEGLEDSSRGTREAAFEALALQARRYRDRGLEGLLQVSEAAVRSGTRLAELARDALVAGNDLAVEGAVRVLGAFGGPQDAWAVVRAATLQPAREAALSALESLGAPAGQVLLKALPDMLPDARLLALKALSLLRTRSAIPTLIELAREGGEAERAVAIEALGALGDPSAIDPLARLLAEREVAGDVVRALVVLGRGERASVRAAMKPLVEGAEAEWALRVLGALAEPEDVPALKACLRKESAAVRLAAAEALRGMAEPGVAEALRFSLADEVPEVRAAGARGLGSIGGEGAGAALILALADREPAVAAAAAEALGELGDASAAGALDALLDRGTSDPGTPAVLPAIAAVRALSRLGEARLERLKRATGHADSEVVKEALRVAASLPWGGEILLGAATHPRWDVRRAAGLGLAAAGQGRLLERVRALLSAERDPLAAEAFQQAVRALEACPVSPGEG